MSLLNGSLQHISSYHNVTKPIELQIRFRAETMTAEYEYTKSPLSIRLHLAAPFQPTSWRSPAPSRAQLAGA